ncbi:MAG: molybdopterin converting factor subunit 1 [Rhodospirillaceae bacterium]
MKLLYFAWLRTTIGVAGEEVTIPPGMRDVADLLTWLATRGPTYAAALADRAVVRVAVNQCHARPSHPVEDGDEVALFPPVTGG